MQIINCRSFKRSNRLSRDYCIHEKLPSVEFWRSFRRSAMLTRSSRCCRNDMTPHRQFPKLLVHALTIHYLLRQAHNVVQCLHRVQHAVLSIPDSIIITRMNLSIAKSFKLANIKSFYFIFCCLSALYLKYTII